MIDRPAAENVSAAAQAEESAQARLLPQLRMMLAALIAAPVRSRLVALAVAIFAVIAATAYGQIRLNSWNKPFYDALSRRDMREFVLQLGVFGVLAGALLALNVAQRWLTEMLKLKLREGLVHDLVQGWLAPRRAFKLASAGAMGVNPDQRMHEDARHLTELSADLGIGLLQASVLLATFVSVLWALSSGFVFHYAGWIIQIPGYMVWAALLYAGSASLLSYWVGSSLIDRNAERYGREADLRFSLVRVNEHIDAVSLAGGEADEARRIEVDLAAVLRAMRSLVSGLTNLTWVTAGYGWFTLVAPILVAAPMYFAGSLSFGGLMMAAAGFTQVQSSLRWFVDNFSTIADWRATLLRVASFRRAVLNADTMHSVESRITFGAGTARTLEIDRLEIASTSGCMMLEESPVTIKEGERVLIVGEPGAGKTLLFRVLAGLWPWGSGRITLPAGADLFCLPRTSYFPPGTLREVLAYPVEVSSFPDESYANVLYRLGLRKLEPLLEQTRRWDRELSEDQQQALTFARVLLHAPQWVLIDGAIDAFDHELLERVHSVFSQELQASTVIYIGRALAPNTLFPRILHLINDPTVRRLARLKLSEPGVPPQKQPAVGG